MIDYKLISTPTFQSNFETNAPTIISWIKNNPGKTYQQIATGTGFSLGIVQDFCNILANMGLALEVAGGSGETVVWHVSDWSSELESNIQNARNWLDTHNNQLMTHMQADLGVPYEIAERLGYFLQVEGSAMRLTAV